MYGRTNGFGTFAGYGAPSTSLPPGGSGGQSMAGEAVGGTLITVGGAVLTVPIAGWIVGSGLIALGGTLAIVAALRKDGKRRAEHVAKELGLGEVGRLFANEYVRLSKLPTSKVKSRITELEGQIRKLSAQKKPPVKVIADKNDKLNAAKLIYLFKTQKPQEPTVAPEGGGLTGGNTRPKANPPVESLPPAEIDKLAAEGKLPAEGGGYGTWLLIGGGLLAALTLL